MDKTKWNPKQLPLRNYLWHQSVSALLQKISIKPNAQILEFTNDMSATFNPLLSKYVPKGTVNTSSLTAHFLTISPETINPFKQTQHYDFIFGFFPYQQIRLNRVSLFLETTCKLLKSTGQLLILIPAPDISSTSTYRKVCESGVFPNLKPGHLVDKIQNVLEHLTNFLGQSPFSTYQFRTFEHTSRLPDLDTFKLYLQENAFTYKETMPTTLSDSIINLQVELFNEYSHRKYDGKYLFRDKLHYIHAIK